MVQYTEQAEEDSYESEISFGCELALPEQLSSEFQAFYQEFQACMEYIIKWDYEILP